MNPIQTDGCTSAACSAQFSATSSLSQGQEFARLTRNFHGGRRTRRFRGGALGENASYMNTIQSSFLPPNEMNYSPNYSVNNNSRKNRKNSRSNSRINMRGGALAEYPLSFDSVLPQEMHGAADIGKLDQAFSQLPQFAGKYGMNGGARRTRRGRKQRGGMADIKASAMILSPSEEPAAMLNPQWYMENQVVPSFVGPANGLVQKGGRKNRKHRKASRNSRKHRKASRKHRK